MTLITASELGALQAIAESGMTMSATVLVRSVIETDDGQENVWATGDTLDAWLYEITAMTGTLSSIAGAVGINETFSLRVPVGSNIHSGDHVAIGPDIYNVQHTNEQSTYKAWLICALKLVE